MTSPRKIKANRENARASTGPKTASGRARSAKNALRHALSVPVSSNPALSGAVQVLAHEIAGIGATVEIQEIAHQIAEAQLDLCRVRYARHQALVRALGNPYYDYQANLRHRCKLIGNVLRGKEPDMAMAELMNDLNPELEGPQKFAMILSQTAKTLATMDRYERRALSRRKFAIRALDKARRRKSRSALQTEKAAARTQTPTT
jgi:hypothetical protein